MKTNKSKRIKRNILVYLLLVLMLSSCSLYTVDRGDADDRFSFATLESPLEAELVPGGYEGELPEVFTVISEKDREEGFAASVEDVDIFKKAVFERNMRLGSEYSVTLEHKTVTDLVSYAKNAYLSEEKNYNMMLCDVSDGAELILSGVLEDLSSVEGFSAEADGYSTRVMEDLSLGGKMYFAAGDATPSLLRNTSVVMVNTDLLSKLSGEEALMRAVRNGRFTFETMTMLSLSLKDLNGAEGDVSYGIKVSRDNAIGLFLGGGGRFYETDSVTGMPYAVNFGEGNRGVYSALMKLYGYDVEGTDGVVQFSAERASTPLFTVSNIARVEALSIEKAPFKALPMPKLSTAQKNYISYVSLENVAFTALPKGGNSPEGVAVMNIIYSISEPLTDVIADNCEGNSVYAENSLKTTGIVDIIKESMSTTLLSVFNYGELSEFISESTLVRLSGRAFEIKGDERAKAASAALSILISSLN